MAEMAHAAGVPAPELVVEYIRRGAPVVGEVPASGMFELIEEAPEKTLMEVLRAGTWARKRLLGSLRPSPQHGVDEEITRRTREEVSLGKASGPFTFEEMNVKMNFDFQMCFFDS